MAKSIPYTERKFDKKKKNQYDANYARENYDRLGLYLPKGYKEKLKEAAEKEGISVTELIKTLIDDKLDA